MIIPNIIFLLALPMLIIMYPSLWVSRAKRYSLIVFLIFYVVIGAVNDHDAWFVDVYAAALLLIVAQISESGRLYWSRIFPPYPSERIRALTKSENFYLVWAFIVSWLGSLLLAFSVNIHALIPIIAIIVISIFSEWKIKDNRKYLIPAVALYLADPIWKICRCVIYYAQMDLFGIVYPIVVTAISLALVVWLIKAPSYKPIICLFVLQIFIALIFVANMLGLYFDGTLSSDATHLALMMAAVVEIFWRLIFPQMVAIIGLRKYRKLSA